MSAYYAQIVALRNNQNDAERGYQFEAILREILPWSSRPPVVMIAPSEQIDAFFDWNGNTFIVEAKAKRGQPITAGSHDWEDFELKIRKRKGCIGLFCSLYPVHANLISAAESLNREGACTIVLHGDIWDELRYNNLPFSKLISYMIMHARGKFIAAPPPISSVAAWMFDRETLATKISGISRLYSSVFLRRYQNPRHEALYVHRHIDELVSEFARSLRPSKLTNVTREEEHNDIKTEYRRIRPQQIFIVRDYAGTGKTTLAVQIAQSHEEYFGLSRAAIDDNLDNLQFLFDKIGPDSALAELSSVDRPLIFVFDSLDEAITVHDKHREIYALFRYLDEANKTAEGNDLLVFPMGYVFTVREEYWRSWEAAFEGLWSITAKQRISRFTEDEFREALDRYSSAFGFIPVGKPTNSAKEILSIPFNLQVFAEANAFAGNVSVSDVLKSNVIDLFFERKSESALRQRIPGLTQDIFLELCSQLALRIVLKGRNQLRKLEILDLITHRFPHLSALGEQMLLILQSEYVIISNPEEKSYRLRHSRFIEYLTAYAIVSDVYKYETTEILDSHFDNIVHSSLISIFSVHDYIRYISERHFQSTSDILDDYYSTSSKYMSRLTQHLRSNISSGVETSTEDIALIIRNTSGYDPQVAWNAFFVLAAKSNRQAKERLLEVFRIAWKLNQGRPDRWKLIDKLNAHKLLLCEDVLYSILQSENPKEWQVFLGCVIASPERDEFPEMWDEANGAEVLETSQRRYSGDEWDYVRMLLQLLLNKRPYIPGMTLAEGKSI